VVTRLSTVAPLACGGESKNCEAPVLNVTSMGKYHHKNCQEEIWTSVLLDYGLLVTVSDTVFRKLPYLLENFINHVAIVNCL
jgi:hypothetical protein